MHSDSISTYLHHLRELPFVTGLDVETVDSCQFGADAILHVRTSTGTHRFLVETKRSNITREQVNEFLTRRSSSDALPWILLSPSVGRSSAQLLERNQINYLDQAGNCRLQIQHNYFAQIQGRRQSVPKRGRGLGVAGYRAMFAFLARPELLRAPIRTIAEAAGVSKSAVAESLARHAEEGLLIEADGQRHLLDRRTLLDQWIAGYSAIVRPRLLIGTYRTPDKAPAELEQRVEHFLGERDDWAWGGGAGAMRLAPFYRGQDTVLHITSWKHEYARRLNAVKDREGPLIVLAPPGPIGLEGVVTHTAHPLLVYTELMSSDSPRAREAANEIRERHLEP